jgi:pimeloyl-ACP methyl ester carboxylesterase
LIRPLFTIRLDDPASKDEVAMAAQPEAFTLTVPDQAIADLRERLGRTRYPDQAPGAPWAYGTDVGYLQQLVEYWRTAFDWRAEEARLNAFAQYKVPLCGIDLHFLHVAGKGPAPCLMRDTLGYPRFAVQGGDWGAITASRLGYAHPDKLIGIHVNLLAVRRDQQTAADAPPEEKAYAEQLAQWLREETGYQWIQGTRPQTLAFGLTDSPSGLAAWIIEKFRAWSDCGGDVETAFTRDRLLANISFYWFTGAIGSSFWPYYARMHRPWPVPEGRTVDVPTGYAEFPREILRSPRSLAARTYTDIRRWSVMPRGGHFAALEQPEALANEVREFFRPLREV